jgi:DNA polymerase I
MKLIRYAPPVKRLVVKDEATCADLLRRLERVREAAVDVEWDGNPDRLVSRPQSIQLAWAGAEVFIHTPFLPRLKAWIRSAPTGIFYSAKGDMWWLANAGMPWKGDVHDTMVMDYLCDENTKVKGDYAESLKARHAQVFKHPEREGFKKLFGKQSVAEIVASGRVQELEDYGCADARDTWEFYHNRKQALTRLAWAENDTMWDYFRVNSAPFTKVLYQMERRGFRIDVPLLNTLDAKATAILETLEGEFYAACTAVVNLDDKKGGFSRKIMNSPVQLKRLFYEVLKYPAQYHMDVDRTTGQKQRKLTTDETALIELENGGFEIAATLAKYRKMGKLKGTYIDGIRSRLSAYGRLHTDLTQAFTVTGRLSSRDPNLQNVPRMESDPLGIRNLFIPSQGMVLFGGDYAQLETRIMAHMSGDEDMIAACEQGDIYAVMASFLFKKPLSYWDKESGQFIHKKAKYLRQVVKAIVLGVGFGKMAKSIASDIGCSETAATNFMNMYFGRFRKFYAFMQRQKRDCREKGYVRTITGRYRRIPEIRSSDFWKMSHAERQSLNAPVQGSAADIVQKAMQTLADSRVLSDHGCHLLLQVHDEVICEGPSEVVPLVQAKMKEICEHPFAQDLRVQLVFEPYEGPNWGAAKG